MGGLNSSVQFEGAVKPSSIEKDGYEPELSAHRFCEIPTTYQWRFDYGARTDGQPVYQGWGAKGLAEASDGWLIWKFTYTTVGAMDLVETRKTAFGTWSGRTGLTYE